MRPRHPIKDIELVLRYAESKGWRYQKTGNSAHAWGKLLCPFASREGHKMSIWSTPRNPQYYAKKIKCNVDACEHQGDNDE